ncbi:hypothetical protein [Saccharibacillus sp. JS10]|uniref:hypothetical protein n=1 Tax=Saccharibacillus sp. JS10 TaxID=2950552 RepID=UPI00210B8445|nr:hypothetical protein [Saccharibacillus sp. JS10]MCQ4086540.1 hypothetical protein [Saccharibacillus sp. JS10]
MDRRKLQVRLQQKMFFDVVFVILAIVAIFYFDLFTPLGILLPLLLAALRTYTFIMNVRRFRRLSSEIQQDQPKSRLYNQEKED